MKKQAKEKKFIFILPAEYYNKLQYVADHDDVFSQKSTIVREALRSFFERKRIKKLLEAL